jgi:hypothetical protein
MTPLSCRVLGHRWHFRAEERTLRWDCDRCAAFGGRKEYSSEADAQRYAHAFEGEPRRGEQRFLLGAAPLWLARRIGRGRRGGPSA